MWCLETIVALNQKVCEFSKEGKSLSAAYRAVGIQIGDRQISRSGSTKKSEEKDQTLKRAN